ncbi:mechanosensitive ion channel [Ordospora pajunii]|uniref:mechanosensitive ion channel n=1 Tax=Ordospora pajunii TaxID=3039483 RepID=UPI00295270C2|nr:mechanosensitive ion channel [Ordospora pajunii]KAH9411498.1 mechanosensitive ion channel [Ordospora pajunii]
MASAENGNGAEKEENAEVGRNDNGSKQDDDEEASRNEKKEEIINDIIASNSIDIPVDENQMAFAKEKVIQEEQFSWMNMDRYLHQKYSTVSELVRIILEITIVTILLMGFPVGFTLIMNGWDVMPVMLEVVNASGEGNVYMFMRFNFLALVCYVIFVSVSAFANNILYIMADFLKFINVEPSETVIEVVQIINSTSWCWKQSLTALFVFLAMSYFSPTYKFKGSEKTYWYIFITSMLMYSIFITIILVEKAIMCFFISEIRMKEYRNRIWEINYKTFVFKKLAAISEASPGDRKVLIEEMRPDIDHGFYLKYNDLKLNSVEAAEMVAKSIFGFLEIHELRYENLQTFFLENFDEVYLYLSDRPEVLEVDNPPIVFEDLRSRAEALYYERLNISKTLQSKDNVINKLDMILAFIAGYIGTITVMMILGINYTELLAAIVPSLMAFSWIFSDNIKDIYNCFVFLLVSHPYDFGDWVVIDGQDLRVSSVDLMSSTFIAANGRLVYIPTTILFHTKIHNIRRSGKQFDEVTIIVDKATPFEKAQSLRDSVGKLLSENSKSFSGEIYIKKIEVIMENAKITFAIQHQSNFQDVKKTQDKREELITIFESEMKAHGINHFNSYIFT